MELRRTRCSCRYNSVHGRLAAPGAGTYGGVFMTAMRVVAGLLLSVCLVSAQLGWFHQQSPGPQKKKEHAEEAILGVVVKRSPDSFVVRAVDTRIITFKITDSTLYFRSSRMGESISFEAGHRSQGSSER